MNRQEILTEVNNALPENFDTLTDPKLLLHFLMSSVTDVLEKNCGLVGDWVLVDGNLTLIELMKDSKGS